MRHTHDKRQLCWEASEGSCSANNAVWVVEMVVTLSPNRPPVLQISLGLFPYNKPMSLRSTVYIYWCGQVSGSPLRGLECFFKDKWNKSCFILETTKNCDSHLSKISLTSPGALRTVLVITLWTTHNRSFVAHFYYLQMFILFKMWRTVIVLIYNFRFWKSSFQYVIC